MYNGSELRAHEILSSAKVPGTVNVASINASRKVITVQTTSDLRHGFEQHIVCGGFSTNFFREQRQSHYVQFAFGNEKTSNLPLNATATEVKAALEALSSIGGSTVQVEMFPHDSTTSLCSGGSLETGNMTITKVTFSHVYLTSGQSGIDEQAPPIIPLLYGLSEKQSTNVYLHAYSTAGLVRGDVVLLDGNFMVVSTDRRQDVFDNHTIVLSGVYNSRTNNTQLEMRFFPTQEGALGPDFVALDQKVRDKMRILLAS